MKKHKLSKKHSAISGELTISDGPLSKTPVSPESSSSEAAQGATPPKLARRSLHRHSSFRSGRTIAERREKLETASERTDAHKKIRRQQNRRVILTIMGLIVAVAALIGIAKLFMSRGSGEDSAPVATTITVPYAPTIEVMDEGTGKTGTAGLTSRMSEYIGQLEADLRELGLIPVRAVIPAGAVREVDFYLDGYTGHIKTIVDRGTGVTAEDTERMLRYLAGQGVTDFEYIDVRLPGKAYWK
ncbi:hypothetical protein IKE79_01425 [Candidatus Saccharibacteria bacterium]|nr:hypothetical protein [Candidatus Saccharibacteria bacterium]